MAYNPSDESNITINYDAAPNLDFYRIVPTHWFDTINTISSSFSTRDNFGYISDFFITDPTYTPVQYYDWTIDDIGAFFDGTVIFSIIDPDGTQSYTPTAGDNVYIDSGGGIYDGFHFVTGGGPGIVPGTMWIYVSTLYIGPSPATTTLKINYVIPSPDIPDWSIRTQNFAGYGDVFINDIAKDMLTYDENWFATGSVANPNSWKKCHIQYGEGFSRRLRFNKIEPFTYTKSGGVSSTIIKVYFEDKNCCLLEGGGFNYGDRVLMVKTDSQVPDYNTYGRVISASSTGGWAILDITYVPYQYQQEGYLVEGIELYDYSVNNYTGQITTTTNHNLNVGDRIVIQMDTVGRSAMMFTASFGATVSSILSTTSFGNPNILATPCTFSSTFDNFMQQITSSINQSGTIDYGGVQQGGFGAFKGIYDSASGYGIIYLFSKRNSSNAYEGFQWYSPTGFHSSSGFSMTASTMTYLPGYDDKNFGFNTQISGYYNVATVLNNRTFTLDRFLPDYYTSEPGSEYGTIYSTTDYQFRNVISGSTYSYLFASIDTQNDMEPNDQLAGIINKPFSSDISYYTNQGYLSARNIFGNNSINTFKGDCYNIDYYNLYEVFTVDIFDLGVFYEDFFNNTALLPTDSINTYIITRYMDTFPPVPYQDTITFSVGTSSSPKVTMGVGPWNLNEAFRIDYSMFSTFSNINTESDPIYSLVDRYDVAGFRVDGTQSTQVTKTLSFTNKKPNNCGTDYTIIDEKHPTYQLCWLNEWGGWDYYTFKSPLQRTYKFDRKNFYKSGNFRDGVKQITSQPSSRGNTGFKVDRSLDLLLVTDHLNDMECKLMESLFAATYVYLIKPNTPHIDEPLGSSGRQLLYPVTITSEEMKTYSPISKMKFYEVNIRIGGYNYYSRQNIN